MAQADFEKLGVRGGGGYLLVGLVEPLVEGEVLLLVDVDVALVGGGGQVAGVLLLGPVEEGEGGDVLVLCLLEHGDRLGRENVPDPDAAVVGAGGQVLVAFGDVEGVNVAGVALEVGQQVSGLGGSNFD